MHLFCGANGAKMGSGHRFAPRGAPLCMALVRENGPQSVGIDTLHQPVQARYKQIQGLPGTWSKIYCAVAPNAGGLLLKTPPRRPRRPSSRPAETPSKRVLDGPWMLSSHSLVVDGWASPAHPSPSNRVLDGTLLGFGWALDGRFKPMAWSPVPPGSPSCRGGPLERHRVILGRLGRFVFRYPVRNQKAM